MSKTAKNARNRLCNWLGRNASVRRMQVQPNPSLRRFTEIGVWLSLVALATACTQPEPELEISIAEVGRARVTLDVHTAPDMLLSTASDLVGDEPKTDANGDGTLVVEMDPNPEYDAEHWRSGRFVVNVIAPGPLGNDGVLGFGGADVVAQDSINAGFQPLHLGRIPEAPEQSWIVPLGFRDISFKHNCIQLSSDDPTAPSIGLVAVGDRFAGAPGTVVTIAGSSLTIDESGLGTYAPDAAAFLPLLFGGVPATATVPVEVVSPGLAPVAAEYSATLSRHCSKLVVDEVRRKAAAKEPLLEGTAPTGDMALIAYAAGDLTTHGHDYTVVKKGKRKGLTNPKRLAEARFLFVDTEVSRTKGARCETISERDIAGRPDEVQLVTIAYEPDFVDTKITMYSLPDYEELDSRELAADRDRCAAEVFGSADDLGHWINTRIEEHTD